MKKAILVILPDLPQKSFMEPIVRSLAFLQEEYELHFVDPLDIAENVPGERYFQQCRVWIEKVIPVFDAFFGLSFGGVILQQCFPLFEQIQKPIVLFSTPTFANDSLKDKLGEVIHLCNELRVEEALTTLYQHVFYPHKRPQTSVEVNDKKVTAARVIFGLQQVLDANSKTILQQTSVEHLHLIGEHSNLVNADNVITPKTGRLLTVPQAGMRVLEDNLSFCKQAIFDRLNGSRE